MSAGKNSAGRHLQQSRFAELGAGDKKLRAQARLFFFFFRPLSYTARAGV